MGTKLNRWRKIGRFITGIVVLCFFLPFFGVSCDGLDVITVSGADMVGGCKPGGMIADMNDEMDKQGMGGMKDDVADAGGGGPMSGGGIKKVDREPLAIIALLCAVLAFGLAWVRTRGALIATLVVALAGLGALGGLYVKVSGNMNDLVEAEKKSKAEGGELGTGLKSKVDIEAGARMGFWLTLIGLGAVAGLAGMALTDKQGPTATAVGPYPPGSLGPPPA